ncbi:MAG: Rrf2 family transcriptional regulator [Planctomycetia bacterium]|nr:Rrf2 family transcriptional regulator [Planctomycetia bacterium]
MKLSRSVGYALQATLLLAETDGAMPVPCSKLAAAGHMPERFLLQILRSLVNYGILDSQRGVEGGYTLRRGPSEISLLDLIEAVDGPLSSTVATGHGLSTDSHRRLKAALHDITAQSREQLQAIRLSTLLIAPHKP